MMKFLFYLMFLMPLSFLGLNFVQSFLFYMMFFFIISSSFFSFFSLLSFSFGVDGLSYYMIILSVWISSLMILASTKIYFSNNYYKVFSFMVMFLLFCLIITFSSLNLFIFYIFFEVSLVPLLMIIIGWGYQPERLLAGVYLIFYTLLFSFPMMIGLFILYQFFSSFMFFSFDVVDSVILYFLVNLVFFVKIPMFMIHLWLPKAHVEAPVSGSMILAGVTLKLGGYGLIRLMKIFMSLNFKLNLFFVVLSVMGGLIISLICLYQTDIKLLIAYSSVSHMGLVMGSILTLNYSGVLGSLIMMIAHGLCSSALFCLANIYYERLHSRSMYMLKGLLNIFPSFSLFMFLASVGNMAAPPSLNLLGEIILLKSLVSYNTFLMLMLIFSSFFSAVYSIYLFSYTNHGKFYSGLYCMHMGFIREYLLIFLHLFPLYVLILMSDLYNVF
uniref:NADH-ubiquinone oxidoreductase chain 4 n=1 Tax=Hypocassida subferruginea TaxID=1425620 RepID=A0A1P8NM58_9CUCU|nr:NADH dehydrogenase subunit 4 [Hypocassida subferruginea]